MKTIQEYNALALFNQHDFSELPLKSLAVLMKAKHTEVHRSPINDAMTFYCLNHLTSVIKQHVSVNAPLNQYTGVFQAYTEYCSKIGLQLFYYMFCICVQETRHLSSIKHEYLNIPAIDLFNSMQKGSSFDCITQIFNSSGDDEKSNIKLGDVVSMLDVVFNDHSWPPSFGGKAWGHIAAQVGKFINGQITTEIFIDTAFTLSHNTGHIFNKGFFYENDGKMIEILDVQRAGLMPEYVRSFNNIKIPIKNKQYLISMIDIVSKLQLFGDEVDWNKVHKAGPVGHYGSKIKAVKTDNHSNKKKEETKKPTPEKEEDNSVVIFPGFKVSKVKKIRPTIKSAKPSSGVDSKTDDYTVPLN